MTDEPQFKEGDRVRVRANRTDHFIQPWRDRFAKGRKGTVVGFMSYFGSDRTLVRVHWDHRKGPAPAIWHLSMSPRDLELVPEPAQ